MIDLNPTQIFVYGTIWTGIVAFIGDRVGVRRERAKVKAARKAKFLPFIRQWESEAESLKGKFHEGATQFSRKIHDLAANAAEMELSYRGSRKKRFRGLVDAIRQMKGKEVGDTRRNENGELIGMAELIKKLRTLILFVEKN